MSITLTKTAKDRCKTKISRKGLHYIKDTQESEQQPAGGTAGKMRERINTFETVLNIDQFLVRFIILYNEVFSYCWDSFSKKI